MKSEILRIKNLCKKIRRDTVLSHINMTFYAGEIHVLIGRNGTGKTTLVQTLNGNMQWDSGEIYFKEKRINYGGPAAMKALGIGYVSQDVRYVPSMTVAENIFLLNNRANRWIWNRKSENIKARHYLDMVGIGDVEPDTPEEKLNTAQKKSVELARELSSGASFIILDEFMETMTSEEIGQSKRSIQRLKEEGITVFIITNKLEEAFELADRITVMRQGNTCYTLRRGEFTKGDLIRHLLGGPQLPRKEKVERERKVIMQVEHLKAGTKTKDVSFDIHEGEILALTGHGKKELMESLYGLRPVLGGEIRIRGQQVSLKSPLEGKRHRISYMSQNRKQRGLIENMTVKENISIGVLNKVNICGVIKKRVEENAVKLQAEKLYIEDLMDRKVRFVSKGSRQKVLLAKCLMTAPRIMIVINPTEGADNQSSGEIQRVLLEAAQQGIAVLMCSDDPDTVCHCADRVLELADGRIVREYQAGEYSTDYLAGGPEFPPQR